MLDTGGIVTLDGLVFTFVWITGIQSEEFVLKLPIEIIRPPNFSYQRTEQSEIISCKLRHIMLSQSHSVQNEHKIL